MKFPLTTHFTRPAGLGTVIKTVIHAGVDAAPISADTKRRIKACPACARRAAALDSAVPNINPLAKS